MIDHTGIGVADVARSARFYDAVLGVLGWRRVLQLRMGTTWKRCFENAEAGRMPR